MPKVFALGDGAVVVQFPQEISAAINEQVVALQARLLAERPSWLLDLVPGYCSLLVEYDPLVCSFPQVSSFVQQEFVVPAKEGPAGRLLEIPTLYGGETGPDLIFVSEQVGLSPQEVIDIHTSREYLVYMIGFTPGFPYLGGMDERIACPRRQQPRTKIAAGSVGIAGSQTGVYSVDSPGGWQVIGHTPLAIFDACRQPPALLACGDRVRFVSINY